jgi:hypothetical protein
LWIEGHWGIGMKTYVKMMRDIQYWYAVREGNDGTSLHTSVLLLSVLAFVNIVSIDYLIDELINGRAAALIFHSVGKGIVVGIVAVIVAVNIFIARLYNLPKTVEIRSQALRFPRSAIIYIVFTLCIFLVSTAIIFVNGHVG